MPCMRRSQRTQRWSPGRPTPGTSYCAVDQPMFAGATWMLAGRLIVCHLAKQAWPPAAARVDARINLRRGAVPAITWLRYLSRLRCSNGARRPLRVLCVLPAADAQTDRLAGHLGESGGQALSLPGRTANDAAVTVMCSRRSLWRPRPSKRIRKSAQLRCTSTACHRHGVTNSSAVTRRAWGQAGPPRCQGIALGTVFQERRLVSTVPS